VPAGQGRSDKPLLQLVRFQDGALLGIAVRVPGPLALLAGSLSVLVLVRMLGQLRGFGAIAPEPVAPEPVAPEPIAPGALPAERPLPNHY
jgi:hypothetical protein